MFKKALRFMYDTLKEIKDSIEFEKSINEVINSVDNKTDFLAPAPKTGVEIKPLWSTYNYIYKPVSSKLPVVASDSRLYFTIPIGVTSDTGKAHYLTFPMGGHSSEIIEFCYDYSTGAVTVLPGEGML